MTLRVNQLVSSVGVSRSLAGRPALSLDGLAATTALDVHFEDRGVVDEPVDGGQRHGVIWKDPPPLPEGLVGGDQHGASFVTHANQFEEHARPGLILGDVGDDISGPADPG